MTIYTPYTYYIKWSNTGAWYYGVEYSTVTKTANPDNLWSIYFTSSNNVKEYRKLYGEPDIIKVTKTFESSEDAILWENKFLTKTDAKNNPMSLNGHNSDGLRFKNKIVSEETRKKQIKVRKTHRWWNNGNDSIFRPAPPDDSYVSGRLPFNNVGAAIGKEKQKGKIWITDGNTSYMISPSEEIPTGFSKGRVVNHDAEKLGKAKGKKWWNNGKISIMKKESPGPEWVRGRLIN